MMIEKAYVLNLIFHSSSVLLIPINKQKYLNVSDTTNPLTSFIVVVCFVFLCNNYLILTMNNIHQYK